MTSSDYHERLWESLPDELEPPDLDIRRRFLLGETRAGERALDLGCGTGTFTAILAAAGALPVGVEVAESALRRARTAHPELNFRMAPSSGRLPFEANTFDLVWASEVIEHVADTEQWLAEIRRVLVPGGRLLLTTPNHPRVAVALRGIEHYSKPLGDHLHLYTRRSLGATLAELGFEQVAVRAAGGPPGIRRLLLARALRPPT